MSNWLHQPEPSDDARIHPPFLRHPGHPFSKRTRSVPQLAAPALLTPPASLSRWAREILGFQSFPAQAAILDCPDSHVMLCCSRQFGKTTLTALKAAHHALTVPSANVVVGSPSERQSILLVRKAVQFLKAAGVPTRNTGGGTYGARLPNGSAIYALPMQETTTRGFDAVSLLIFEEAAYVPDVFYHMATAFQAEERIRKGDAVYRREYECEFVAGGAQIISRELWDAALDEDDIAFNGGKSLWPD